MAAPHHSTTEQRPLVQKKFEELYEQGALLPGELDAACIADLDTLSQEQACLALHFLVSATKTTIHNKSAFLKGIIAKSRAKESQMRSSNYGNVEALTPLHPLVQAKLDTIFSIGFAKREEIDSSILDSLAQFDPMTGCQIVDIFAQKNLSKMQSKSGFLAGVMKRFRERSGGHNNSNNNGWMHQPHMHHMAYYGMPPAHPPHGYAPHTHGAPYMVGSYPVYTNGKGGHKGAPLYPSISSPQRSYNKQLPPVVQERLNLFYSMGLMNPSDLDPAILESMAQFPAETGLAILEKLSTADLANIRNKNGFLAGIMKRFRGGTRCVNPEHNLQAQALLPPSVQLALENLYATGLVQRTELDGKVVAQLSDLDEAAALDAVSRFQNSRLSHVSNRSGFLVGIINKIKAQQAENENGANSST
uniref:Heterogeneous nuclear ribonucleoprotein Q acidic domain-containing protein n=1 Tax=Eutreptiella gymnastica TaxID=73025 RepID=A0A7S1ITM1_9EUGL|mmetsp:Transcript_42049/g.75250  ORF Transcript_42049/g.75250 Transcript_42049/m.75250 type:complete len:417 (+) Transcript_42049:24-1274(+)